MTEESPGGVPADAASKSKPTTSSPLVIVLSRRPLPTDDPTFEVLAPLGARVVGCWTDSPDLAELAREADAFVASGGFSAELLALAPRCRIIARDGIGYDSVDVAEATRRDVWVTIIPDALVDDVADHTMLLLIAANRRLTSVDSRTRSGEWRAVQTEFFEQPPRKLRGSALGLVGLGRIGRAVAERARAFGMTVLATDPASTPQLAAAAGAELAPFDELLARSDFVSLHVPLLPQTRHLVGERELRLMRPSAVLVNTCRGPVVDEAALVRALGEGWIRAAGLDVFELEPIDPASPLLRLPNVVVTPHIASISDVANRERRREAAGEVRRVLSGEPPREQAIVNRELFSRRRG